MTSTPPRTPSLLLFSAFLFIAGLAFGAPVKFDLPAQPASSALQAFSRQAAVEVLFPFDELQRVTSREVKGEVEPAVALKQLLSGTGYESRQTSKKNFVISAPAPAKPGSINGSVRDEVGKPVADARVGLADSDKVVMTDKRGRFLIAGVAAGAYALQISADGMQNTRVTDITVNAGRERYLSLITIPVRKEGTLQLEDFVVSAKKIDGTLELDPLMVTDNRVAGFSVGNLDIARTENDVQPYVIFQREELRNAGAVDIADFLKNNLTMNTVSESNHQIAGANSVQGNSSQINLRGLGFDKTVVLINGRRAASVNTGLAYGQPDLNGIPLSLVDRIEILPTSSSAIYGASAIGGVVNVILKRDVSGGTARVSYDNTWDTDAPIRRTEISYGRSFNGGNTSLRVSAGWSDSKALLLRDRRQFVERGVALTKAIPNFLGGPGAPFPGDVPNISTAVTVTAPLVLKDGRAINSRLAHVPKGTAPGISLAALSNAIFAAGGDNSYDLGESTTLSFTGLLMPMSIAPATESVQLSLQHKVHPRLELFLDAQYYSNKSSSTYNPLSNPVTVNQNAPTNPFTTAVVVRVPMGIEPQYTHESCTRTLTLGSTLQITPAWTAMANLTVSQNRFFFNRANGDDLYFTDMSTGKLNPFVDLLAYPIDYTPYIGTNIVRSKGSTIGANLKASGPLRIPLLGEAQLVTGMEYRVSSRGPRSTIATAPASKTVQDQLQYERTTDSRAVYLETSIPLVKPDRWAWLNELSAQASGRYETYNAEAGSNIRLIATSGAISYTGPSLNGAPIETTDSYSSNNTTFGFKTQHWRFLSFRASVGSAFIPPDPVQLVSNPLPNANPTTIVDRTTNTTVQAQTLSGGNPDLKPQTAHSQNVGAIFMPSTGLLKGLRLNVEYYRIEQQDAIGALTAQQIVDQEALQPGRVTRNAAGIITLVDITQLNLFRRDTDGIDVSLDYRRPTPRFGTFTWRVNESRIISLKQQVSITLPYLQYAGFPNETGAAKVKRVLGAGWEGRRVQLHWNARYFGSYYQTGAPGGPLSVQTAGGGVASLWVPAQGATTVPSQMYHDVMLGLNWPESRDAGSPRWARLLGGTRLQLGVRNVFDKEPPIDVFARTQGYFASPYADTRLRTYFISLERNF